MSMDRLKHKTGMSVMEIGIAMLVAAVMFYAGGIIFRQLSRTQNAASENTVTQILTQIANRQVWQDIRNSGHSMNVLLLSDDNNNNFFDLNPEIACSNTSSLSCTRSLTITGSETSVRSFVLLVDWSRQDKKVVTISPESAYLVGSTVDYTTDASLTFQSTKFAAKLFEEGLCASDLVLPNCGTPHHSTNATKLILLKSAGQAYRLDASNMPNLSSIRRSSNVMGSSHRLNGPSGNISFLTFDWLNRQHPEDPNLRVIASFDDFLRSVPPLGGRAGLVQAYEVRAVRYCLAKPNSGKTKNYFSLYREECNAISGCSLSAPCNQSALGWGKANDIAPMVKSVTFKRPNINLPIIYFDIETHKSL